MNGEVIWRAHYSFYLRRSMVWCKNCYTRETFLENFADVDFLWNWKIVLTSFFCYCKANAQKHSWNDLQMESPRISRILYSFHLWGWPARNSLTIWMHPQLFIGHFFSLYLIVRWYLRKEPLWIMCKEYAWLFQQ